MDDLLDPLKNPVTYAAPFFVLTILIEFAALKWLDHDDNTTGYALKDARTSISMGVLSLVFLTAFKVVTFFGFVAEPPEDADPSDPLTWAMANPNLGVAFTEADFRRIHD